MSDVVVVTGTGTEVGKTWVTSALIRHLKEHDIPVTARKPVQSFDVADGSTDADVLASALGIEAHDVCPLHRWYEIPMAPPMAAEELGLPPIALADLVAEIRLPEVGLTLVEGVGGVRSPLADDADTADLADALGARLIVLVADAGLGTINSVVLSLEALARWDVAVFLNRFEATDRLHQKNLRWLSEAEGIGCITEIKALAAKIRSTTRPKDLTGTEGITIT